MQRLLLRLLIVLTVAATMAVLGASATYLWVPRPVFGLTDLILPSCLTWLLLSPLLNGRSLPVTVAIGLLSPLLGAAFVILLRTGPADFVITSVRSFLGAMLYGVFYIVITAPVTLATGVATALTLRRLLWRRSAGAGVETQNPSA